MVNEPGNQLGSLERLGIELETQPPENILTPGEAKGVRFQISQPKGYYPTDVDTFMESSVIPSLGWYATTLHERDLDIHKLGEKLDQAEVDLKNLKTELAAAQYSAPLGAALEKNQDDKEMTAILEQLEQARAEVAATNAALATATAALATAELEATQFKEYSAQQDDYITALLSQMDDPDGAAAQEAIAEEEDIVEEPSTTPTFVEPQSYDFVSPSTEAAPTEDYVFEPEPAESAYVEPQADFAPEVEDEPRSYPAFTPAAPVEDFTEEPKTDDPYAQFYDSAAFLDEDVVEAPTPPRSAPAAPAAFVPPAVEEEVYEEEALAIIDPFEDEEPESEYDEEEEDVFAALNNPTPTRINPTDSPAPRVDFPSVPRRTPIPDDLPQGIRPDDLE